jgi:glycosyltransferase involved in cell wall biosynthesis
VTQARRDALAATIEKLIGGMEERTLPPPTPLARIVAGDLVVSGFLGDGSGIGRGGRATVVALEKGGLWVQRHDLRIDLRADNLAAAGIGRDGVWLCHANPPEAVAFMRRSRSPFWKTRYRIGYWVWELPRIPDAWARAAPLFHEIWTPSQFSADAIRAGLKDPAVIVRIMPHPLPDMPSRDFGAARGGGPFTFLAMCDVKSTLARKNPFGAIAAFKSAFAPDDTDVLLQVKLSSTEANPLALAQVVEAVGGRGNIVILTERLSDREADALIAGADVFVSLHRSEGFGLSIAQAMAAGRAVIATDWSGNIDFSREGTIKIPYTLVEARDPTGVYEHPEVLWAEPDLAVAAAAMARLAASPAETASLGAAAFKSIRARLPTQYDPNLLMQLLSER